MAEQKLILDFIDRHEKAQPDKLPLTRPLGAGKVANYTWGQTVEQPRHMATHLGALADFERLQMIVIAREPWSIENGGLTPTRKIKRSRIEAGMGGQPEIWYRSRTTVVWG